MTEGCNYGIGKESTSQAVSEISHRCFSVLAPCWHDRLPFAMMGFGEILTGQDGRQNTDKQMGSTRHKTTGWCPVTESDTVTLEDIIAGKYTL